MSDDTNNPNPPSKEGGQPDENKLDSAVRQADSSTPDGQVQQVKPDELADDKEFNALEKLSEDDLEKMLSGEKPAAAAPAAQPGAPAAGTDPASPSAPAATQQPGAPAATQADDDDKTVPIGFIPKARFDEVNNRSKALEEENVKLREERAYLAGRDSARVPDPANEPDQEGVLVGNLRKLNENFNASNLKLAEQFDAGEITAKEWKEKEQKLKEINEALQRQFEDKLDGVRRARSAPDPETVNRTINDDPWLKTRTAELRTAHPWIDNVSPQLLEVLKTHAAQALANKGISLGADVQSTWYLRQEMAAVGTAMGLNALGRTAAPAGTQPQNPNAPTVQQGKDKLALAGNQPPMPTAAGVNAPTDAVKTNKVEEMTEDQLSRLSTQDLDAILAGLNRKVA
jgi:hypothetical protein